MRRLIERDAVGDHEGRVKLAALKMLHHLIKVPLARALTRPDRKVLHHHLQVNRKYQP